MIWRGHAFRHIFLCCGYLFLTLASPARADVERIEVLDRSLVAGGKSFGTVGPYELLRGRIHFTIDANAAKNQIVTDLRLAPRDVRGDVRFAADFMLIKPADATRANGRLLYDVPNRGMVIGLAVLNDAPFGNLPTTPEYAGNGFLMEQGYAVLWTGWSWDVPPGDGRLRADFPVATDGNNPIDGFVLGEIIPTSPVKSAKYAAAMTIGYEPARIDDPNAQLTVRKTAFGKRTVIPRSSWRFGRAVDGKLIADPTHITLDGGFEPGLIYTVRYRARGPRINGLGLAGIRDTLLFFRGQRTDKNGMLNPLVENGGQLPKTVLTVGVSQSGRLLQTMIAQGFAVDGRGRRAFDGALISNAGAGKGGFNLRFGQPGRFFSPETDLDFPSDWFPFTSTTSRDPITGKTGSILGSYSAPESIPHIIYVNASTEYWARSASLLHTSVDGKSDVAIHDRVRIYAVAGGSHYASGNAEGRDLSQCGNNLDYRPLLRASLINLDGWVTLNETPPASAIPTLRDKSLGGLPAYLKAMPKIPGLRMPSRILNPPRLDFGPRFTKDGVPDHVPPRVGKAYETLVPMPDENGLDRAGIHLPDIAVPLGTYTGWNLLHAATRAPGRLARADGAFIPFSRTENERIAANDPRPSIAERYPTRDAYIESYAAAALDLAKKKFLVGADINHMVGKASKFYDRLVAHNPRNESCAYLKTP